MKLLETESLHDRLQCFSFTYRQSRRKFAANTECTVLQLAALKYQTSSVFECRLNSFKI